MLSLISMWSTSKPHLLTRRHGSVTEPIRSDSGLLDGLLRRSPDLLDDLGLGDTTILANLDTTLNLTNLDTTLGNLLDLRQQLLPDTTLAEVDAYLDLDDLANLSRLRRKSLKRDLITTVDTLVDLNDDDGLLGLRRRLEAKRDLIADIDALVDLDGDDGLLGLRRNIPSKRDLIADIDALVDLNGENNLLGLRSMDSTDRDLITDIDAIVDLDGTDGLLGLRSKIPNERDLITDVDALVDLNDKDGLLGLRRRIQNKRVLISDIDALVDFNDKNGLLGLRRQLNGLGDHGGVGSLTQSLDGLTSLLDLSGDGSSGGLAGLRKRQVKGLPIRGEDGGILTTGPLDALNLNDLGGLRKIAGLRLRRKRSDVGYGQPLAEILKSAREMGSSAKRAAVNARNAKTDVMSLGESMHDSMSFS